ncbi:hypothetical protein [Mucilaginibacter sp.]|uniref:hypothetical protein n=1 Tax=Mucilaginibacter sp. TaxID=1882438 RepID=UPI0025EAFB6A|nr:hypothetical protein [Mucilaginibacter sp.]
MLQAIAGFDCYDANPSRYLPKLSSKLPTNNWPIPELTIKNTSVNCTAAAVTPGGWPLAAMRVYKYR